MSKSKFTPGPWVVEDWPPNMKVVFAGAVPGNRPSPCMLLDGDQEANARLIAAAPDLLEAAKEAFQFSPFHSDGCKGVRVYEEGVIFDTTVGCDCYLSRLRAAIAKASLAG